MTPSRAPQDHSEPEAPAVVRRFLESRLRHGAPRIEDAARHLALSPRSLHRRLAAAGLTYRGLLDGVRRDQALRLLRNPALPVTDVALRLGYSDPAHFTRAFHRWVGLSPRAYRAEKAGGR